MGAKAADDDHIPMIQPETGGASGPGPAFVNLDDTLANRRLALELPAPIVMGLEEELAGMEEGKTRDFAIVPSGLRMGVGTVP